jgi:hypothetical protein
MMARTLSLLEQIAVARELIEYHARTASVDVALGYATRSETEWLQRAMMWLESNKQPQALSPSSAHAPSLGCDTSGACAPTEVER